MMSEHRKASRVATRSPEWMTPKEVVDAAQIVLGEISLDPASSAAANRSVRAKRYFTVDDDGLSRPWSGRVFLNPPGGRPGAAAWWQKLAHEWTYGRVESAVFLGFSIDVLQTAQVRAGDLPVPTDFPHCVPRRRIRFLSTEAGRTKPQRSPPYANVIVYLPPSAHQEHLVRFRQAFAAVGAISLPLIGATRNPTPDRRAPST